MFRTFRLQEFAAAEPEPAQKKQKTNGAAAVQTHEEMLLQELRERIESKKTELGQDKLDQAVMEQLAKNVLEDFDMEYLIHPQEQEARIQRLLELHQEPADATLDQEPDDDSDDDDPDTYKCEVCNFRHPWTQQPCIPDTCEGTDDEGGTGCCEDTDDEHSEGSQDQDTDQEDMALVDEPEPEEVTCGECGNKWDGYAQCKKCRE